MKSLKFIAMITLIFSVMSGRAQSTDLQKIEQTITGFAAAGDANDAATLANFLDDNYTVIMNRLFGSAEVKIMPRAVYLEKIRTREFGGDTRVVTIKQVVMNGAAASAQVTFAGTKMTATSFMILVRDAAGNWKIVSDVPVIN